MGVGHSYQGGGRGVHRTSYPSGPCVDSQGNPVPSPNATPYTPPPEPVAKREPKRREPAKLPNPDPYNFEVQDAEQVGAWLVLKVKYPDCTNFEGVKVLVFSDTTALDLLRQGKFLDPHFFENQSKVRSPVARFVPTQAGWDMAVRFARMMGEPSGA